MCQLGLIDRRDETLGKYFMKPTKPSNDNELYYHMAIITMGEGKSAGGGGSRNDHSWN